MSQSHDLQVITFGPAGGGMLGVDPNVIARDLSSFLDTLSGVPWFLNLGKPHPQDVEVARIHDWEEWPGPEGNWGDWYGRYPALIRETIEAEYSARERELAALWGRVHEMVMSQASTNVPRFDPDEDAWFGPTTCVWHAAYIACLTSWHILLRRPLPQRLAVEWAWFAAGHWRCGYAEEPPGYEDESDVYMPVGKLLVY